MKGVYMVMSLVRETNHLMCHGGSSDLEIAKAIFYKVCKKWDISDVVIQKCLTKQPIQYNTIVRCIYITSAIPYLETIDDINYLN